MMGEPIRDVEKLYTGEPQPSEREVGFRAGFLRGFIVAETTSRSVAGAVEDEWEGYCSALAALSPTPQPSEHELGFREGIEAAANACDGEHLVEPQADDDLAYDRAVADCITAIRALSPTPQPSEGERELAEALVLYGVHLGSCAIEKAKANALQYTGCTCGLTDARSAALAKFNARTGGDK